MFRISIRFKVPWLNNGIYLEFRWFEPYAGKLARMDLTGGKFVKIYLSGLGRGIYYGSYRYPRTLV